MPNSGLASASTPLHEGTVARVQSILQASQLLGSNRASVWPLGQMAELSPASTAKRGGEEGRTLNEIADTFDRVRNAFTPDCKVTRVSLK